MTILSSKNRKIIKDKKFMQWVCSSLPCYVCNLNGRLNYHQIQFHHLQGKHRIGAMIRDDSTGIPICFQHHQELTFKYGERKFWEIANQYINDTIFIKTNKRPKPKFKVGENFCE